MDTVAGLFRMTPPLPEYAVTMPPGQFPGRVERQWASELVTVSVVRHLGPAEGLVHAHEHACVTLLLRGDYREVLGSRTVPYQPLTATYQPCATWHRDDVGRDGADLLTVEIAPALLAGLKRQSSGTRAVQDLTGGPLVWNLLTIYADLAHARHSPLAIEEPVAELLDAIDGPAAEQGGEPAWLDRVGRLVRSRFREPLSLSDVAREARVQPVQLSRVYRRVHGRPVRDSVHRLRVLDACRLMQEEAGPIADVALRTGFAGPEHLTAVCRRLTGLTPGTLRTLLHAPAGGA